MEITAIRPRPRDPSRAEIYVDGIFRLAVAADVAYAAPLRVGDAVTEDALQQLERRDEDWRVREDALRLLSFRGRTVAELRRRLAARGHAAPAIERCVDDLARRGLVDDASFAQSFVRDRIRLRPRGAQRLLQELRTRGVDWETARATVDEVLDEQAVSETELARQAAARWSAAQGETRLRARRRLYNFLARRGFGAEAICEVVEERLP